jgi:hypothetical protein
MLLFVLQSLTGERLAVDLQQMLILEVRDIDNFKEARSLSGIDL